MNKIVTGLLISAWLLIAFLLCRCSYLTDELDHANNNLTALTDTMQTEAIAYQTSYNQMRCENDSLRKALKINRKTKEVVISKVKVLSHDTLYLSFADTIIKVKNIDLDTTLMNDWRTLRIKIQPVEPTQIRLSDSLFVPTTISWKVQQEKVIVEPKKWWIQRLFQRRVKVRKVYIYSNNPLVEFDGVDYIQIID